MSEIGRFGWLVVNLSRAGDRCHFRERAGRSDRLFDKAGPRIIKFQREHFSILPEHENLVGKAQDPAGR